MPTRKRRAGGPAFTVELPTPLPARKDGDVWWLELPDRELRLSNLDKVFWPDEGITKGDVVAYYFNVAGLLLPHLERRPLTMKRMPDGVTGDSFYEKTAPSHTPDWVHRCAVLSDDAKTGRIDYLTVDDLSTLLFVANLGAIEMHPLHSRCDDVGHPDYLFFDLDPFPPYTYEDVLAVARHVNVVLGQLGLTGYPKTSGATGMQIYVPVERGRWTYDEVRAFVGACGRLINQADPGSHDDGMEGRRPRGQGVHRPQHEPGRREHRGRLFAPTGAPSSRLHAAHVGRGRGGRVRASRLPDRQRLGSVRAGRDLWAAVLGPGEDLAPAMDALGVEVEPDPSDPLPRTAAPGTASKTSAEIAEASKDPALFEYVRRREFGAEGTTEPAPGDEVGAGNSFVIDKHRATRLHYDVRLEKDGGLPSWAVPKGLPTQKGDKRLAVQTEVHPLEYGTFEGTIPKGTTAPARSGSSTTAGTSPWSGPTRRSRSVCTAGATRASSSTS